ncbi:glycosyltransferase family 4 protein [Brevundimonas sp. NIBR11]|uniref:glycosyltransferase family 4 protein n=1 Tax=Brevundimonas sp. NIBR11 TaxID=3015999 RepID=UPI0022F06EDD|nr:glycosyltransferase family 4 protein [Brevundimonas sp. NIBR11]WGM31834.1 D-inositol 3-phosphate glycosyltransferase [Brevundimonas sp. NIBR11]
MSKQHRVMFLLRRLDLNDGVSSHLDTLCGELASRGHAAMILSGPVSGQETMAERLERLRSATERIDAVNSHGLFRSLLPAGLKAARAFKPTVIHAHGLSASALGRVLSWISGAPLVTTSHVLIDQPRRSQRVKAGLLARMMPSDRMIAISSALQSYFADTLGVRSSRIDLIPNGIRSDDYTIPTPSQRSAAREAFGLTAEALVCVLPGRLDRTKGHHIAVEAIRRLGKERPVVCLFPGSGDGADEIIRHALVTDRDRERFRFLGQLPNLRAVFQAADVLLLPSHNEGFALVVVEAMLSGCVPVRTPSAGASDQIEDGVGGFIVPFADPTALADRIERLFDPDLRHRLADAAHARARREFTADVMTVRTLRTYDMAIVAGAGR